MRKTLCMLLCLALTLAAFALAESSEVDVDLTGMDSNAISDRIYDIMDAPEDYRGKTVRIAGHVSLVEDESGDPEFWFLTIGDYTSCCAQNVEFVPSAPPEALDDIAFSDTEVTLSGTLDFYEEDGYTDLRIIDAIIAR